MSKNKKETEYFKCAMDRLRDAEKLMELTNSSSGAQKALRLHRRGALYIAGYGVECMLKAYIIHRYNCKSLSQAAEKIRQSGIKVGQIDKGSSGHNIGHLFDISLLDNELDTKHREDLRICKTWDSTWRYEHSIPEEDEAKRFIEGVKSIVKWVAGRI